MGETTKKCHRCGKVKPLSQFYSQPDTKSGVANLCKACVKSKVDRWQKNHSAQVNAKNRSWYNNHKVVKAKVLISQDQDPVQAEEALIKALNAQHNGDTHQHSFPDKGVDHVSETIKTKHQEMIGRLTKEIIEILEMP